MPSAGRASGFIRSPSPAGAPAAARCASSCASLSPGRASTGSSPSTASTPTTWTGSRARSSHASGRRTWRRGSPSLARPWPDARRCSSCTPRSSPGLSPVRPRPPTGSSGSSGLRRRAVARWGPMGTVLLSDTRAGRLRNRGVRRQLGPGPRGPASRASRLAAEGGVTGGTLLLVTAAALFPSCGSDSPTVPTGRLAILRGVCYSLSALVGRCSGVAEGAAHGGRLLLFVSAQARSR